MAELSLEMPDGQRIRIDRLPCRVGSAADNDVVIRGVGVQEHHLQIEESGNALRITSRHPCYFNGRKVGRDFPLKENGQLTLGIVTLPLFLDVSQPLLQLLRAKGWAFLVHPLAATLWFLLALMLPLWIDFLHTQTRYVFNLRLLFVLGATFLLLVWLMHGILWPVARRYFLFPLLGLVSCLSFFHDLSEQATFWFNFQYRLPWLDEAVLMLVAVVFLLVVRGFLRAFVPLFGRMLNRFTLVLALPCLLLLLYSFLQPRDFYMHRPGSYPDYHRGLLPEMGPWTKTQSVTQFLQIKNSSEADQ